MKISYRGLLCITLLTGCGKKPILSSVNAQTINGVKNISYLALGDSYTIGESVRQDESFPYQLAAALKRKGVNSKDLQVIARTGWTTDELKSAIIRQNPGRTFDIVTLLIGVNNQVRQYSQDDYRKEFKELLNSAISFAGGLRSEVFVLSIPDWGATPFAAGQSRNSIAQDIDQFNAICKEETLKAGVAYTDITPVSRMAASDASLIAPDGLHPSGKMYAAWVQQLVPQVIRSLDQR